MASERDKIIAEVQAKAITLARILLQTRVRESAVEDFMRRGFTTFADEPLDGISGRQWTDTLARSASHLFESQGAQPGGTRLPVGVSSLATERPRLTPEEEKLRPETRLTIIREKEAAQAATKAQGGRDGQ